MKTFVLKTVLFFAAISFFQHKIYAQVINWKNISMKQRHLLHVNVGADYGVTAVAGYHQLLHGRKFPAWFGGDFSVPSGKQTAADDFKVKLGAQIRVVALNHIQISARLQAVTRRYQNQSVRLFNFGSDMAATVGYYSQKWYWAVESGFDKAIVTNFKHSEWYRKNIYDHVKDGWYEPATGGNFYYGFQTGYSMSKMDVTLKAGKLLLQDFISTPLLPFYGQLGVNFRF